LEQNDGYEGEYREETIREKWDQGGKMLTGSGEKELLKP